MAEATIKEETLESLLKHAQSYTFVRLPLRKYISQNGILTNALLVFVERGEARLVINGSEYCVGDHDFLFLFPHSEVKLIEEKKDCEVCIIGYFMALQESVTMHIGPSFFVAVMSQTKWTMDDDTVKAARAFCVLFEYNINRGVDLFSADMAASLFAMFIQMFYQQIKDQLPTDREAASVLNRSLWWRFVELVGMCYKEHHKVIYYADHLCVSPKYLTQIVKRIANTTPKTIIDRRLAGESAYLLAKTDATIQEISYKLGFPDQSYFGRFFKRAFGMSPLAFRLKPDLNLLAKLTSRINEVTNKDVNLLR